MQYLLVTKNAEVHNVGLINIIIGSGGGGKR